MPVSAGDVFLDVHPELAGFNRELSQKMKGIGSKLAGAAKAGIAIGGAAAIGGLALVVKTGISEFSDYQKGLAQAEAVIKSTGGVAGVTSKHLEDMASALQDQTGATDDSIVASENLLLTFTNIQNKVGKGNDIFDQATSAVLDMSQALGQDTKSSAIQLGKALNDPIKGVTALRRVGVSFDEAQIKVIKTLVKSGKTLEAQKFILKELNKEFGGSAKAFGETLPGKIARAKRAFEDMSQSLIGAVAPAFATVALKAAQFFKDIGPKIGDAIEAIRDGFKGGVVEQNFFTRMGEVIRVLYNFLKDQVIPFVQKTLSVAFSTLGRIVKALIPPFKEVGKFVADILFPILQDVWDVVLLVVRALGKLIAKLSKPVTKALKDINKLFRDNRDWIRKVLSFVKDLAKFVTEVLAPALATILGGALTTVVGLLKKIPAPVYAIILAFAGLKESIAILKKLQVASVTLGTNWKKLGTLFTSIGLEIAAAFETVAVALGLSVGAFAAVAAGALAAGAVFLGLATNFRGMRDDFVRGLKVIGRAFQRGFKAVVDFFKDLPSKVLRFAKDFLPKILLALFPVGLLIKKLVEFGAPIFRFFKELPGKIFNPIKTAFSNGMDFLRRVVVSGVQDVVNVFLAMAGFIVHAAAKAFGWIPFLKDPLKKAVKAFDDFRVKVNADLDAIKNPTKYIKVKLVGDRVARDLLLGANATIILSAGGHPEYQEGGWVTARPGQPQLAIVHGGEFVLSREMLSDLASGRASMGGGTTYNETINVYNPKPEPSSKSLPAALRRRQLLLMH